MRKFPEEVSHEIRILEEKYSNASTLLAIFNSIPTIPNLIPAYQSILDYILNLPLSEDFREKREKWLETLDEIRKIIYMVGEEEELQELMEKYEVTLTFMRQGVKYIPVLANLFKIGEALREILIEAGEVAKDLGLRTAITEEHERRIKETVKGMLE